MSDRCRNKAEYELLSEGTPVLSKRVRSYPCGHVHFDGEVFLCQAHAHIYEPHHKNLNEDTELAEWFQRVMG